MTLETGSFINDLTPANPLPSDAAGQGDDHLRLIKATVQGTFPQMGAIFGQVRRQDTALSISSTWNTNHFVVSASATATVVLTLPPAASITTGFYVDITTIGTGTVSLAASGAGSINGGATLSIPRLSSTRAYFVAGTGWLADTVPHAQGGTSVLTNLAVDGTSTLSGTVVLSNGQLVFPAAQNASANANTLDDYEEGTWTPTLIFATMGNFTIAYAVRNGTYTKIGNTVTISMQIGTSTFTHTTAAGQFSVTGLPFAPTDSPVIHAVINGLNFGAGVPPVAWLQMTAASTQGDFWYYRGDNAVSGGVGHTVLPTGAGKSLYINGTYRV